MVSSYMYDICKDYLDKFLFKFDKSQLSMSILSGKSCNIIQPYIH